MSHLDLDYLLIEIGIEAVFIADELRVSGVLLVKDGWEEKVGKLLETSGIKVYV